MRKLFKFTTLICLAVFTLVFSSVHEANASSTPIKVFLNDSSLNLTVNPIVEEGTTLVEFRTLFSALGLEVGWDGPTKKVTGKKEDLLIELTLGSKDAFVNGKKFTLPKSVKTVNGRTLVPLRFVGESTGAFVNWDGKTNTITIHHDGEVLIEEVSNADIEVTGDVSYMLSKEKVYTYKDYLRDQTSEVKYDANEEKSIAKIVTQSDGEGVTCFTDYNCYVEDEEGLYVIFYGHIELLTYPVKVNKKWTTMYEDTREITAIKTVTVPAGTFENVVVVKEVSSHDPKEVTAEYYAPNVGLILKEASGEATGYKITKEVELIKLK